MGSQEIRFEDGDGYERYMGMWSRLAGDAFLAWLKAAPGLRWLDVGCGNGAFTETLAARCAPASIDGVDPSGAMIDFARSRPALRAARFRTGDAMALPYPDGAFDAAVMPLVIFFVPEPAKGVAEMARVVKPGGLVTAYAWDIPDGGLPYDALLAEIRAMDIPVPTPPNPDASRLEALRALWSGAGLEAIETHVITVKRTFADLEDYWETALCGPSVGSKLRALGPEVAARLKERLRACLPADSQGRFTCSGRANAIQGRVGTP